MQDNCRFVLQRLLPGEAPGGVAGSAKKYFETCQFRRAKCERLSMELELAVGSMWIRGHELRTCQCVHECQKSAAVIERSFAAVRLLREAVATQKYVERRTNEIAGCRRLVRIASRST